MHLFMSDAAGSLKCGRARKLRVIRKTNKTARCAVLNKNARKAVWAQIAELRGPSTHTWAMLTHTVGWGTASVDIRVFVVF